MSHSFKLRRYLSNWHVCLTIIVLSIVIIWLGYLSFMDGRKLKIQWKKEKTENRK